MFKKTSGALKTAGLSHAVGHGFGAGLRQVLVQALSYWLLLKPVAELGSPHLCKVTCLEVCDSVGGILFCFS